MFNERNDCCGCQPLCKEPTTLPYEKCNDCEKTKGLPMPESFYDGVKLLNTIEKDQLPPFTIRVSKLPFNEKGIITIDDKEIFWYEYNKNTTYQKSSDNVLIPVSENKPGEPGELRIIKRGLHPAGTFNGLDGKGNWYVDVIEGDVQKRYNADYNNCKFMYRHRANVDVKIDANNHLFIRMATAMTCCRGATEQDCGTVRISKLCPDSGECPTAVSICDFANCGKRGIVRELSKCVPEGQEIAISWNDYSTQTRPGITQVTDVKVRDCNTGAITTQLHLNGDNIPTALNAFQYADKEVYGSVKLSIGGANHTAHANNHHANNETAGLVKLREIKQRRYEYAGKDVQRFGDPLTNCGNNAKYVISDYDWADETTHGLVRLSKPSDCVNNTNGLYREEYNTALNKHDYANPENPGSVFLSATACNSCKPIVVSDNDERLFAPYLEIYEQPGGGEGSLEELTMGINLSGKVDLTTEYARTNITSGGNDGCQKNSRYYGFNKTEDQLFKKNGERFQSIIIPKTGLWSVDFQVRLVVDPNLNNYNGTNPIADIVSQARVQYKEPGGVARYSPIGFKEKFTHHEFTKDMVALVNNFRGTVTGIDKHWREEGVARFASAMDCGYDSFLGSSGLFWFTEGTEVWISCDLDDNGVTNYAPYRQRLHLAYVDSVKVERAS